MKFKYELKKLKLKDIQLNTGQIPGVPKNPRFIRDKRFEALCKSISDLPEMLNLRELIVYVHDGKHVCIGGNMRLRAMRDLGMTETICKVVSDAYNSSVIREIAIKDNIGFGQDDDDILANEWDQNELIEWGHEGDWAEVDEDDEKDDEPIDKGNFLKIYITDQQMTQWDQYKEKHELHDDADAFGHMLKIAMKYGK